jgi:hypothetical protein
MRGKIRIDGRKNVLTAKGYPIIIYLTQRGEKPKTILTGYHTFKEHWNKDNALPTKKHPDYYNLLDYLQIKKIELKKLLDNAKVNIIPLHEAEKMLSNVSTGVFYTDAMNIAKDLSRPYQIPLNSFNKYFPNYPYEAITEHTTKEYVRILINTPIITKNTVKKRSANGVISYIDSLNALWNKLGKPNNPFSTVRPIATPTSNKDYTVEDLQKIKNGLHLLKDKKRSICTQKQYMIYNLLCFYLGGIDLYYLKEMRYDKHVVNGRVEFYRKKGKKFVKVSNKIFPQAEKLLKEFDCYPYLVPLYQLKDYNSLIPNMSRDFDKIKNILGLSKKPYSKAPRYTFINRGQDLLIDERIMKQLVGHSQSSTHSIYKRELPYHIIDEAHKKIIEF